mmetsp:Transcript_27820/g.71922  ORF Transcript_27820/g.71922 Transcript_27820/m.71922 type:complete len:200 (+) Transcript_27820:71-670(+)
MQASKGALYSPLKWYARSPSSRPSIVNSLPANSAISSTQVTSSSASGARRSQSLWNSRASSMMRTTDSPGLRSLRHAVMGVPAAEGWSTVSSRTTSLPKPRSPARATNDFTCSRSVNASRSTFRSDDVPSARSHSGDGAAAARCSFAESRPPGSSPTSLRRADATCHALAAPASTRPFSIAEATRLRPSVWSARRVPIR